MDDEEYYDVDDSDFDCEDLEDVLPAEADSHRDDGREPHAASTRLEATSRSQPFRPNSSKGFRSDTDRSALISSLKSISISILPKAHVRNTPSIAKASIGSGKFDFVVFTPAESLDVPLEIPENPYGFSFKMPNTNCELVRAIFAENGFAEVHPNSSLFNFQWTGANLKPHTLRNFAEFQKANHFPRSSEITRKDRLYHNVRRMQSSKGFKNFNIVPRTFILPKERDAFCQEWKHDHSSNTWIVKPASSSRGRGISLVSSLADIPHDEAVACKYISNPLLIDGFKFDLRLYVVVLGYDPLRIYLYEEGLARFATSRFSMSQLDNRFVHLTNYSINKKSANYVSSPDANVEDFGNKWSLSALLNYLKSAGIDTSSLLMRIEDLIVKTIIAGELPITVACRSYASSSTNCFELYGFDVLIDDDLRPWLLEVNLSPSLACEAPLDLKLKSHLVADFLTMGLIPAKNPSKHLDKLRTSTSRPSSATPKERIQRAADEKDLLSRSALELEVSKMTGFLCIFPTENSWVQYGAFLEDRRGTNALLNATLEEASLFPISFLDRYTRYHSSLRSRVHLKPVAMPAPKSPVKQTIALSREISAPSTATDLGEISTSLTSVEARMAFSCYLEKLHSRLSAEGISVEVLSKQAALRVDEQLVLIVEFMLRAAQNLSSAKEFWLDIPPRTAPIRARFERVSWMAVKMTCDRRKVNKMLSLGISGQLAKFKVVYDHETQVHYDTAPRLTVTRLLNGASEDELENLLAKFAREQRSSSVFLGHPTEPRVHPSSPPKRAEPKKVETVATKPIESVDDVLENLKRLYKK